VRGLVGMAVSVVSLLVSAPQAVADIGPYCASSGVPKAERKALARADFAFEGLVVDGRPAGQRGESPILVSPLTFEVLRWLKGEEDLYGFPVGSKVLIRRVWDANYLTFVKRAVLDSFHPRITTRVPGEIVATDGQRWRIYAVNQDGINLTCSRWLGSHPIVQRKAKRWPFLLVVGVILISIVGLGVTRARKPSSL
jgi:hypothetical protein